MKRRTLLAASAAALAAPRLARSANASTIRFVPEADVVLLDPVVTPAAQTREHAYLVYDTLYGLDDQFRPQPQMVAGAVTENDGKLWKLTLRDGLMFHDGTEVLARDCAASIRRWGARDAFGQALMAAADEVSFADDRVITVRLKRPFPLLPDALAKPMASMCPMMPERLAASDPYKAVTDPTGSGPYRFVADERVPGARLVYQRFAGYVPRENGTPSTTAGPKRPTMERVEWAIIPDNPTAVAALQRGEVDWVQTPAPDLLSLLRRDPGVTVRVTAETGLLAYMRFNQKLPPFDNPAIRRALIGAVSQADYMTAVNGEDRQLWRDGIGYFCPGTPLASDAGMGALTGPRDYDRVRRDLAAAGYKGERVAMMVASDVLYLKLMGDVTADVFRKVGLNLDYQSIDWTTLVQRRIKKDPLEQGGWNLYCINDNGINQINPAGHLWLRGNGDQGPPGWAVSPRIEALRNEWFAAENEAAQQEVARKMQLQAFEDVPYIPLGQSIAPTAYRSDITGVLNGQPTFWNVRRG